jgi:hypothetical protein
MIDPTRGNCWHCGQALSTADYGREADCPSCHRPTRVCRNCCHFAPGRPNECVEPMAEPVLEKERANFCEFFEPTDRPTGNGAGPTVAELLRAAEDLFK